MSETLRAISTKGMLDKLDIFENEKYIELNNNVLNDDTKNLDEGMKNQINFLVEFADKIERRNKRNMKKRVAKDGTDKDKGADKA